MVYNNIWLRKEIKLSNRECKTKIYANIKFPKVPKHEDLTKQYSKD